MRFPVGTAQRGDDRGDGLPGRGFPCGLAATLTAEPTAVPWIALASLRSVQREPNRPATGGTPASDAPASSAPGARVGARNWRPRIPVYVVKGTGCPSACTGEAASGCRPSRSTLVPQV